MRQEGLQKATRVKRATYINKNQEDGGYEEIAEGQEEYEQANPDGAQFEGAGDSIQEPLKNIQAEDEGSHTSNTHREAEAS